MHVRWNALDRASWDAAHGEAAASLQQDWAYGAALEALATGGGRVLRAEILNGARRVGLAQFATRRIGFALNVASCSRGPVWLADLTAEQKALAYRALKASAPLGWPRLMLISPDEPGAAGAEALGLRKLARVMTGYSTVVLDLELELDALRARLDGKWRNRLAAAETSGLKVEIGGVKPRQYAWLLEKEEAQRAARGYRALPAGFAQAYAGAKTAPGGAARDALMILRADRSREPAAAMMFLIHGQAATYHIGWTGPAGRQAGAHNLLLWRAIETLKARGVRRLDLGGVDTETGAGLARFKIGAGGEVVTLAGAYA